jgi:hypothetical protein
MQRLHHALVARELRFLSLRTLRNKRRSLTMYADAVESRGANNRGNFSSKRGSAVKRALAGLILAAGLIFAGAQATPTTTMANSPCDMVCNQYIDPTTGQCYEECCPADPACKQPCIEKACKATSQQK